MKFELPSKETLIGMGMYGLFGYAVGEIAGDAEARTPGQWVCMFLVMALLLYIDVRSYQKGLERGTKIAHEVLDDLLSKYRKDQP